MGASGAVSGIFKAAQAQQLWIRRIGIVGDEQGDSKHHGGPEKAIHHYPREHYIAWAHDLVKYCEVFSGQCVFGENFSTLGLTESGVCVGDVYKVGSAVLQVSQARQPCWRLNVRTGIPDMAAKMQATGRTGWYYRVVEPGWVQAGDTLALLRRPNAKWPLTRLLHFLYVEPLDASALGEIAELPFLTPSWRKLARVRLERMAVEDWSHRLTGSLR